MLPGLDDGAPDWDESIAMAALAACDGIRGVIATPHQLGRYRNNVAPGIRQLTAEFNQRLAAAQINLQVLPGGDVRIEDDLLSEIRADRVLTLGDHGRHVLLELPHELYFPLQPVLETLSRAGLVGILSHPERNRGIQSDPRCLRKLVSAGCLMQVTAGSFLGQFGSAALQLSEQMLNNGWIHLIASDGH
ncbi:MAG: hypothetical protein KDA92_22750, partial [Planctomycetales bacterium]|nr:hypothetical protein [Planctomycetales bacterium]